MKSKDETIEELRSSTVAELRSELAKLSTSRKDESWLTRKKIAQLEGENEALVLQNATLEKLSRFQEEH